jgi:hypothetical protein
MVATLLARRTVPAGSILPRRFAPPGRRWPPTCRGTVGVLLLLQQMHIGGRFASLRPKPAPSTAVKMAAIDRR